MLHKKSDKGSISIMQDSEEVEEIVMSDYSATNAAIVSGQERV